MLPKTPEASSVLSGSVIAQRVRCGRPNCHCKASDAALHGPYFYHFWRERGRLKKRYLRRAEIEATRQACARGKAARARRVSYRQARRRALPVDLRALWHEVEAALKAEAVHHGG